MTDAEFANRLSEILFGYREASMTDMLSRARYLARLEDAVTLRGNKQEIVTAYDTFMARLEELTYDPSL